MNEVVYPGLFMPVAPPVTHRLARWQVAARQFRLRVLLLVLLCAVPVAALLATGRLTLAANCFWLLFVLMMGGLMLTGRHTTLLAFFIGVTPWINLLRGRGVAFYNLVLVVLLVVVGFYAGRAPHHWFASWRHGALWKCWLWLCGGYYAFSLVLTGDYSNNLRFFELALMVVVVVLAGHDRDVLGSGLLGLTISACSIGLGMLPHNGTTGRLGMTELEGALIGNPEQLGMALALGFLALTVDHGRWLGRHSHQFWKWLLVVPTTLLLALTTSRAAWLVAGSGILLAAGFGRGQRLRMLLITGLIAVLATAALRSPYGESLQAGLTRTFNSDRSLSSRTSGRSDQWAVAFRAVSAAVGRLVCGYGPGRGPAVYARFSGEVAGVRYSVGQAAPLHSLFMQVLVETGVVGLLVLLVWLGSVLVQVVRWTARHGRLLPLICWGGYLAVIVTVSGNDTASGVALGIALLAAGNSS